MPNVRYCASCSGKTEYTVKIPKCCSECGASFVSAFASTYTLVVSAPKPVAARVIKPPAFLSGPDEDEDEDGEDIRLHRVERYAHQVAASISASDFGLTLVKTEAKQITLGGLLKDPEQYEVGIRTQSAPPTEPSE